MEWIQSVLEWTKGTFDSVGLSPVALPLAFLLGLVSAVASACCTLPVLSAVVGYAGTRQQLNRRANLFTALFFMLGSTLAILILGGVAGFVGQVAQASLGRYWKVFAGIMAIVFGLATLNLLPFKLAQRKAETVKQSKGLLGAALSVRRAGEQVLAGSLQEIHPRRSPVGATGELCRAQLVPVLPQGPRSGTLREHLPPRPPGIASDGAVGHLPPQGGAQAQHPAVQRLPGRQPGEEFRLSHLRRKGAVCREVRPAVGMPGCAPLAPGSGSPHHALSVHGNDAPRPGKSLQHHSTSDAGGAEFQFDDALSGDRPHRTQGAVAVGSQVRRQRAGALGAWGAPGHQPQASTAAIGAEQEQTVAAPLAEFEDEPAFPVLPRSLQPRPDPVPFQDTGEAGEDEGVHRPLPGRQDVAERGGGDRLQGLQHRGIGRRVLRRRTWMGVVGWL